MKSLLFENLLYFRLAYSLESRVKTWQGRFPRTCLSTKLGLKQELSYRERIARQLRTQYVEGIHSNPVTLKSRSRVTKVIGNGTIG